MKDFYLQILRCVNDSDYVDVENTGEKYGVRSPLYETSRKKRTTRQSMDQIRDVSYCH